MPPKKEVEEPKNKLGRPGNTLKMGIVGMPNVGKSTTFNLLSKLNVPAENYPFCTIEPNLAQVAVPDPRFDKLVEMFKPKSKIQATLKIVDIAGLVPGAHKGEGLGNNFLSHIREVDGIFHVVRAFENEEIVHTENEVNPVRDLQIINDELCLKDLETLGKRLEEVETKIKRMNDKEAKEEKETLDKVKAVLEQFKWIICQDWSMKDIDVINKLYLLTAKPVVYLVNLSEEDFQKKKNKWLVKIKDWVQNNVKGEIIPYSAEFEKKQFESQQQAQEETKDQVAVNPQTMMNKIIRTGYKTLDLIYFFTAGEDEVRAWTIREGTKAPQAAGVIHTDFEKGFICAEIMKYDDLIQYGSEVGVKAEGKYLQKGKDYTVEDGEIIFFKFNVGQAKKK